MCNKEEPTERPTDASEAAQGDFVEVKCHKCGSNMYLTKGAFERQMNSRGSVVCDPCIREDALIENIKMQRKAREHEEPPAIRKSDVYIWVGFTGVGIFLGMQVWLLWPPYLNHLKFMPVLAIFIMLALTLSQLRGIVRGENPVWRRKKY